MNRLPPLDAQEALWKQLRTQLRDKPKQQLAVLGQLFKRTMNGDATPLTPEQLGKLLPGRPSGRAIETAASRLRRALDKFCRAPVNRDLPIYVRLPTNRNRLALEFIDNRKTPVMVGRFWEQYLNPFVPSLLVYPSPQFFRVLNGGYVRHPSANHNDEHNREIVRQLFGIPEGSLIPSFSFIPSGLAASISTLYRSFHRQHADVMEARPLAPTAHELPEGNQPSIVLGTPSASLHLINSLEHHLPMRSHREPRPGGGIRVNQFSIKGEPAPYVDEVQEEEDFNDREEDLTKWAVVTRRVENGRPVTVFSGHSFSVLAVVHFLNTESTVKLFLQKHFRDERPDRFQALFKVELTKVRGQLNHRRTTDEKVIKIPAT
jgi:hypothetical protein